MALWELLYDKPILREALKRRAKRHYRRMTDEEMEAILREREQQAQQGGESL